jgi:hypothetical protein
MRKKLEVYFVGKDELAPLFGLAEKSGERIFVRNDLPKWAQMAVLVHEVYHVHDKSTNILWRELKAIAAQFFMPLVGSLIVVILSLSPKRLKFYWNRYVSDNSHNKKE